MKYYLVKQENKYKDDYEWITLRAADIESNYGYLTFIDDNQQKIAQFENWESWWTITEEEAIALKVAAQVSPPAEDPVATPEPA